MQQLQLYIESERVDLFEDESVVITDSVKDLRDITKIYTSFSQQFNLPATKKNNRIFKHYYNYNIINGYDARIRVKALLKVNGVDYKFGKIQLNKVDLKDNIPYSYKVVFYGNTVTLKDLIGDDMLEDLDLSEYDHTYDGTTQITALENELFGGVIKYPLISHTKNFDVSNANGVYEFGTNNPPNFADFKPSIQIKEIFNAIEQKYNIEFGDNFFGSYYFSLLYLWLHRNKGGLKTAEEITQIITNQDDFVYLPTNSDNDLFAEGLTSFYATANSGVRYFIRWEVNIGAAQQYTAKIVDKNTNETILQEQVNNTGSIFNVELETFFSRNWNLDFIVESDTVLNMTQDVRVRKQEYSVQVLNEWTTTETAFYERASTSSENTLFISQHIPKVKIIDFIKDIFKMHNLLAFIERDGQNEIVQVEDMPFFYNEFNTYEITKYVDFKRTTIEKFYPFKEVALKYEGQQTFLTDAINELKTGADLGNIEYVDGNPIDKDAKKYEIEVGFEKMWFERLSYTDTGANSPIQWGYYVDKDQNPFINKPLVHMIQKRNTVQKLSINDGNTDVAIATYNAPVNNFNTATGQKSLHFGLEIDEFTGEETSQNSTLFFRYYKKYIERIYNTQSRKLICDAYLPMQVLLNYKLDDTLIINNRRWKIESVKTNFLKKSSKLTLFNDLEQEILSSEGILADAETVSNLTANVVNSTDISIEWDAVTDADSYNIFVDDNFIANELSDRYTLKVDDTTLNYLIGVQVVFNSGQKSKIKYV